jgi:Lipocalin-like domain
MSEPPFGSRPNGVIILLSDGRMAAIITLGEQKKLETEAIQADAFRNMVAYSGLYRIEPPDRLVTLVNISWFQPWVGSEQARKFTLRGETLDITTEPTRGPATGGALAIGVLSWAREDGKNPSQ